MPSNNQFVNTGIVDGQPVEAFQVSQSFDAFTKQKDYDITISGSLNLTGSLLMTGSLVNEFTGQFSTLGLGVTAPTAPTMLHIKTSDASNDPLVLIESDAASGDSMVYAKNPDTEWRYGLSGANSDSFVIQESKGGTTYLPFNIGTTTPDYAFQIFNGILGVGLGTAFTSNPSSLSQGSIQAANTISSSLIQGVTISASAAGENIHGTASFATEAVVSNTSSYVQLGNIDMSGGNVAAYSASGNFNTTYDIVSNSGTIKGTYLEYITALKDPGGDEIVRGSIIANSLTFGDNDSSGGGNGPFWKLDSTNDKSFFTTDTGNTTRHDIWASGYITSRAQLIASGSSTPSVRVGPNATLGVSASSSSLFSNSLDINYNSDVYVGNYNTGTSAKLNLVVGGAASPAIVASSSLDVTFPNGIATFDSIKLNSGALTATGSLFKLSQGTTDSNRIMQQTTFRMAFKSVAAGATGQILCAISTDPLNSYEPKINVADNGGGVIMFEADIIATTNNGNDDGASWKIMATRKIGSTNGNTQAIGTNTTVSSNIGSTLSITPPTISTSGATDLIKIIVYGDTAVTLQYGGFVKCTYIGYTTGP